ncbi:MAG TPA: dihydrolipoamide acetyltransferase family protein, partial [Myxococcota bacterium]|nr:dihydrolipoamide acetyltransferase family protein [Myxococcota bacterium]
TDKVEAEIPSPRSGVLIDIAVDPGQTVAVGTVLGQVGEANEMSKKEPAKAAPKPEPAKESQVQKESRAEVRIEPSPSPAPAIEAAIENGNESMAGFLSPLVRRIASEHRMSERELNNIKGTGRGGRISKNDILEYLEQQKSRPKPEPEAARPGPAIPQEFGDSSQREVIKPVSTMRRVIMENMVASKATSAHVTTFFEIDYTAIDKVREAYQEQFKKDEQVSLTYTTFLAAAVCQVLKNHPYINASITKDAITLKKDIHLGIAVAIDQPEPGLMVPVIKNADKQNLRGLAQSIADLSSRVRSRKIRPDELSGGTFTITNPGSYGAIIGTPIINQPQVAILGVGQIKKHATVLDIDGTDVIAIRRMGILSLSFDHRLVDGATADLFMRDLKHTLEHWTTTP